MPFARAEKLKKSLTRTRQSFFGRIAGLFGTKEISAELWEELEELLVLADVGVETTLALISRLQERAARENMHDARQVQEALKEELIRLLDSRPPAQSDQERLLTVILVVGVNGSGKTTTIAKLAHRYKKQGKKVALAAADTFCESRIIVDALGEPGLATDAALLDD